jgi:hypothetical protein
LQRGYVALGDLALSWLSNQLVDSGHNSVFSCKFSGTFSCSDQGWSGQRLAGCSISHCSWNAGYHWRQRPKAGPVQVRRQETEILTIIVISACGAKRLHGEISVLVERKYRHSS